MITLKYVALISAALFFLSATWMLVDSRVVAKADPILEGSYVLAVDGLHMLLNDGTIWAAVDRAGEEPIWTQDTSDRANLPVPLSEIQFWNYDVIVTRGGEYYRYATPCTGLSTWCYWGQPPGIPVSSERSSSGSLKSRF